MPAQKRHPPEDPVGPGGPSPPPPQEEEEEEEEEEAAGGGEQNPSPPQPEPSKQEGGGGGGGEGEGEGDGEEEEEGEDSDGEGGSDSGATEEFILVKLAEIRKEVQCPICLGIIRKTRTVMECLHRFCRECIDKSMRLGNNECPACRTHCASRRSLRDDPNYDALIAALYPDIDKYEEEELAFHEEEKNRNKKIQASIAETLRRQTEALGRRRTTAKATAAAFVRKSQGNYRSYGHLRGRGRNSDHGTSLPVSEDEEEEDVNGNDGKDSSSAEEPSPERRQKRRRRWRVPRSSPARTVGNTDADCEENDDMEANRVCRGTSPLRAGNREMLAWGRGGVRSQSRHGNSSGSNGRSSRAARMTKLSEYLRNLEETDDEFDVHLTLLPLDEQSIPNLQRSYLCCRPTLSIDHLCQFIALQTCKKAEDIQIYVRKPQIEMSEVKPCITAAKTESDPLEDLQAVDAKESLARLRESFISTRGDLVFVYCSRKHT